jgi:hypothetical protein
MIIELEKDYSLEEIVNDKLIPWVKTYATLYTRLYEFEENWKRVLAKETTKRKILAHWQWIPWCMRVFKLHIKGRELSKFLKLHNLPHETN